MNMNRKRFRLSLLKVLFCMSVLYSLCINLVDAEDKQKKKSRQAFKADTEKEEIEKMKKTIALQQKPLNRDNLDLSSLDIEKETLLYQEVLDDELESDFIAKKTVVVPKNAICIDTKDPLGSAIRSFWKEEFQLAQVCSKVALLEGNVALAKAMLHYLHQNKHVLQLSVESFPPPDDIPPAIIEKWEIIGPFAYGKLELDADPIFHFINGSLKHTDICRTLLRMSADVSIPSELSVGGSVQWKAYTVSKSTGMVTT